MLLLHTCCAPCSAAIIEWLLAHDIRPTLYFYNPNIYPTEEYGIRKAECFRYASAQGLDVIDDDYDHTGWLGEIKGMEQEPERGARCLACFRMRMRATAAVAHQQGFSRFATTLASSRWKGLAQIAIAGHEAASRYEGVEFWEKNWRKDGLSERHRILLAENQFYNQLYCGCEFSRLKNTRQPQECRREQGGKNTVQDQSQEKDQSENGK
ncbi:MAG: epoxyqueuosine reductase QueH [Tannerellaceae bacterium]|nr:epoxyqueuosine reductase QueH [Tannerellaceae bacterium]